MNKNFMRILVIVLCGIIVLGIIAMPLSMLG
jgi:preprotein translocase subunit Sss1